MRRTPPIFLLAVTACSLFLGSHSVFAQETPQEFFENSVRPLLVNRCLKCHDAEKRSGELRLDSRKAALTGGESGPVVVPFKVEDSLLISAVRREGGLEMPPEEKLTLAEVAILEQWIKTGAVWPESQVLSSHQADERAKSHWAFQPVKKPAIPATNDPWARTPIDAFVAERLHSQVLTPSADADRRTLIRRVSYSLTGLPPTPEEVAAFVADTNPLAYETLIDRLLDSPHYGEHWGRHWLDLARYSDTKGYVYAREERFWVHAWAYRDWVVQSLNRDLPYDRFLRLQLAADQVPDREVGDLAAMGFLTLGRRFLGVTHDIIDDRIDVVCRGTMALTVGCARCHDHKYDPIPTADYYSLYGVFDSSAERMVSLTDNPVDDADYQKELAAREQKLKDQLAASRQESTQRVRERTADYLKAQTELEKYPSEGFDQIFEKSDILPAFVRRWESFLKNAQRRNDPVFRHWHAYREIPQAEFSKRALVVTAQLSANQDGTVPRQIIEAFREPPATFEEVIRRYADLFSQVDEQWKEYSEAAKPKGLNPPTALPDAEAELLRQVLYGPNAPCEVPDEPIVHTETYFDTGTCESLWKLQGEVDRWIISSQLTAPYAVTLVDRPVPKEPRIFRRGDPAKKGDEVPRRFLSLLAGRDAKPFQQGSGRMELANAIIDPKNPLTARVIVNRVWARHFGQGLVATTSDFGLRSNPPSHPELLDWLTQTFIEEGWSLKKLHRRILLSAAYRQSSLGPTDPIVKAKAIEIDPANRLLWRMNSHRLSFEEVRDSLLADSGKLNRQVGGKPVELLKPPFSPRRTLYGLVDRQFFPSTLRVFDVANPDLHIAERSETTVPQQSLFFLNHPFVLNGIRDISERTSGDESERIQALFQSLLQREPTAEELSDALEFLGSQGTQTAAPSPTVKDWQYGYGFYDEATKQVANFKPLPHFTGKAWQGGTNWPDSNLGWVQLSAEGGHPGNDRQHAAVRRWTAPRDVSVQIRSKLNHEAAPGDGIRAFIASSNSGQLQSTAIHQKTVELNVDALKLKAGETIDFVVDIGDILHSDQYHWTATITDLSPANPTVWNSQADFPRGEQLVLTPWEQLVQVLVCSNEFLFVD